VVKERAVIYSSGLTEVRNSKFRNRYVNYDRLILTHFQDCVLWYFIILELLNPLLILIISIYDYSSHVKIFLTIIYRCGALYQKLYIQSKKCSWGWANFSPETCRADL